MTLAYHFVGATLRDGSPVPPDGEWLTHTGPLVMCESGLHASLHPFDALQYAPGPILCRVKIGGKMIRRRDADKIVCRRRMIVARFDATALLRRFAADQALSVAHLWNMPQIVREYLETLDESKRAASRDAAWDVSRDAAWDMSRAASRVAAWDVSRAAAWDAARDAAWDAAWDAARAAAWAVARAAARGASRDAVRDAAWDAAREIFACRVKETFNAA